MNDRLRLFLCLTQKTDEQPQGTTYIRKEPSHVTRIGSPDTPDRSSQGRVWARKRRFPANRPVSLPLLLQSSLDRRRERGLLCLSCRWHIMTTSASSDYLIGFRSSHRRPMSDCRWSSDLRSGSCAFCSSNQVNAVRFKEEGDWFASMQV